MNQDYTHIALVIDRSGSMQNSWNDVCGGYEALVKENKAAAGKCTFTVAVFDDHYELVEDFKDIKKVKSSLTVRPRGMTALLDAIGKTVVTVGEKLAAMKEADRPAKVIVMVQTDGLENVSKEFTKDSIQKLIKEQTDKYGWQFIFVGASLDAVAAAGHYGFAASNVTKYELHNSEDTFKTLGAKMTNMRSATTHDGYVCAAAFSDEEVKAMNKTP